MHEKRLQDILTSQTFSQVYMHLNVLTSIYASPDVLTSLYAYKTSARHSHQSGYTVGPNPVTKVSRESISLVAQGHYIYVKYAYTNNDICDTMSHVCIVCIYVYIPSHIPMALACSDTPCIESASPLS